MDFLLLLFGCHPHRVTVRDVGRGLLSLNARCQQVTSNVDVCVLHDRLARHGAMPKSALSALQQIPTTLKTLESGSYIVREADAPRMCAVLLSGYAHRQKVTGEGQRQILAICIPGDIVDLENLYLDVADHSVQMLTEGEVLTFPRDALRHAAAKEPTIARAISIQTSIDASILREWLTNVGQRSAKARIAHLLCELAVRLVNGKPTDRFDYVLPMNQEHLGDALGLTAVHLNRMLRQLTNEGLMTWTKRSIHVNDWKKLRECGDFNSRYLHPDQISES